MLACVCACMPVPDINIISPVTRRHLSLSLSLCLSPPGCPGEDPPDVRTAQGPAVRTEGEVLRRDPRDADKLCRGKTPLGD